MIELFVKAYIEESEHLAEPDYLKAAQIWDQCAKKGSEYAKSRLLNLFESGLVEEQDFKEGKLPANDLGKKGPSPKILIIDDGEDTLKILSYILKKSGYIPITATDGVDGLEQTLHHPDMSAMLIDLQMPKMNGFEFISTLRKEKAFQEIPIIVITAHTSKELVDRGRKLGIKGWLSKPLKKEVLLATLEKSIEAAS